MLKSKIGLIKFTLKVESISTYWRYNFATNTFQSSGIETDNIGGEKRGKKVKFEVDLYKNNGSSFITSRVRKDKPIIDTYLTCDLWRIEYYNCDQLSYDVLSCIKPLKNSDMLILGKVWFC